VLYQNDESKRPKIFEENIRKDHTAELEKILKKYDIHHPLSKFQAS
jgi:hypothetical protein